MTLALDAPIFIAVVHTAVAATRLLVAMQDLPGIDDYHIGKIGDSSSPILGHKACYVMIELGIRNKTPFKAMKILLALTVVLASVSAFGQKTLAVRAGATYSYIRHIDSDFDGSVGLIAGVQYEDRINEVLSVMTDAYYLDQQYSVFGSGASVRNIDFTFGVKVYVPNTGLHAILAPEFGHMFGTYVNGDKVERSWDPFRFSYVTGAGYSFGKFGVDARYVGELNNQQSGFDFNIQVGLSYKLFGAD